MTVTFTVKLAEFRDALIAVLPHSGTDDTLPSLRGLYLHVEPGDEYGSVSATDRFSFVRARFPLAEPMPGNEPAEAFLTPTDVKSILAQHKVAVRFRGKAKAGVEVGERRFEITSDGAAVTNCRNALDDSPIARNNVKMFENWLNADEAPRGQILWNPRLMAKFEKASTHPSDNARVRFSKNSGPIRITIGEHFEGLLMPVRDPAGVS